MEGERPLGGGWGGMENVGGGGDVNEDWIYDSLRQHIDVSSENRTSVQMAIAISLNNYSQI